MTTTPSTIKVRYTTTVEIDVDAWHTEYGDETCDREDLADNIRDYIDNTIRGQLDAVGVLSSRPAEEQR